VSIHQSGSRPVLAQTACLISIDLHKVSAVKRSMWLFCAVACLPSDPFLVHLETIRILLSHAVLDGQSPASVRPSVSRQSSEGHQIVCDERLRHWATTVPRGVRSTAQPKPSPSATDRLLLSMNLACLSTPCTVPTCLHFCKTSYMLFGEFVAVRHSKRR
jgi:hypothetical protein